MKTLQKLFTAICLITIVGLVGCADPKKTPENSDKTPKAGQEDHTEGGKAHTHDEEGTDPKQTEPTGGPEIPTPAENPDVEKADDAGNAESGSTENKGGVDIPE